MPTGKPFQRFTHPDPSVNQIFQDIYDKLGAALTQSSSSDASTPAATSTTTTKTIVATSIQGASGQAAGPQYAYIPNLPALPSNNPTQGLPYTQDGLVIEVNDQLWRYSAQPNYQWIPAGTATVILSDTHANRIANYPAATYPNALFFETDTTLLLDSNGGVWVTVGNFISGTHSARLSTWPSVQFSVGTEFYETDRTAFYRVQSATGTVNTSGTAVTWASGNHFINTGSGFNTAQWPSGTTITINSVAYPISAVSASTSLTLSGTGAGTQTGVTYTVTSGRWVYFSGQASNAQASIPADLGECDATTAGGILTSGFLDNVTDYGHILQWNGSAWQWGPGENGSAYFQDFAVAPSSGAWQACDGSTNIKYLKKDGTLGTLSAVPNTVATPAYRKSASVYSATISTAATPTVTIGAITPSGTNSAPTLTMNSYTPAGTISTPTFTGAAAAITSGTFTPVALATVALTSLGSSTTTYTPTGAISTPTFTGTPATLTGTVSAPVFTGNAVTPAGMISLAGGDPVANYQAITYFRQ